MLCREIGLLLFKVHFLFYLCLLAFVPSYKLKILFVVIKTTLIQRSDLSATLRMSSSNLPGVVDGGLQQVNSRSCLEIAAMCRIGD